MDLRRQGITLMTAVCAFIATIVIIQLWLAAASVEAFLGGDWAVLTPAAIASFALFLVNVGLLRHALRFDARLGRGASRG